MLKKGILICGIVGISGITYYISDKYNTLMNEVVTSINSTGYFLANHKPELTLSLTSIKHTTKVKDKFGYDWILDTKTNYIDIFNDIESITKLSAGSKATKKYYKQYLANDNTLPVIVFSKIGDNSLTIEASSQPINIKSESASINIPELQIIHYSDNKKLETVLLATNDIKINHNGAMTIYSKPRLLYSVPKNNAESEISFKVDNISVGNVSIADGILATFSHKQKENDNLDISINANFENLSSVGHGVLTFKLHNITKSTLLDAINLGVDMTLSGKRYDTNDDNTEQLMEFMRFAKNGGSATLNFDAKKQNHIVKIESSLKFDPVLKNAINEHNALSLLQAADFKAKLNIPKSFATSLVSPVWLDRFINDKMVLVDNQQLLTDMSLYKMNATINGVQLKI